MNLMKATTIKQSSPKMEQLLNSKTIKSIPKVGDLVTGNVVSVGNNEVHLDLNGLTTGIIRGAELRDESGEYSNLKVGDEATATVVDIENEKGEIELSFRFAGHKKAWDRLQKLVETQETITVEVTEANKGGLLIKLGQVIGFLPVSQLSPEHYPRVDGGNKNKIFEKLKTFIGKKLKIKVITANEQEEKLIVSEKAIAKEEQKEAISKYKIGSTVQGKISGVVDFGAFVEFGHGLEGLVHISELAWKRIDDPREIIKIGQKVKAEIIDIDDSKISLSLKKLQEDPWQEVVKKYKVGQIVEGVVLKVNPFGLFVELDEEIHGLAHVSELSAKPNINPQEVAKPGDKLKFRVVSVEPKEHRLGLSIRAVGVNQEFNQVKNQENGAANNEAKNGSDKVAEDISRKKDKKSANQKEAIDSVDAKQEMAEAEAKQNDK